jgi:PAS domain S-box-containing protein
VKGNSAILIAGSGEAGKKMLAEGYHLEIEAASMIAWCIRNGKARIAQDADMDRVRYQNPLLPKTRSELALPLFSRGQVIGALTVQDARENAFNETDIASLQTMSDQLATAVENANLFEKAQKEITERRAIEKSLRVSEQKFSKVFHSGPDSVTLSEMESGRLIEVNDGFREVFGYSREEAIGHSALELGLYQNPEDRQFVMQTLRKRGSIRNLELTGRHKSGQAFTAFLSAELIEINERSHLITIVRDITERKLAEEEREKLINELEIKNAELERFTYTVSHDLKSPLITIRGFLGYLEKDAIEGNIERLKSDVNRISSAAKTMQLLLDELLELSRVGRLMNEPEEVAFETIVHEALGLVEGRLGDGNIKILVDSDLPLIYADRARLIEVIQNLVDNAAKYVKNQPNPKIEIGVRNKAENPVFYVKDNGVGIDPKYHEKVFGLFEKLDTSSEGTGVGLALVKRIVEVHGGRIWIESESGKGATFCFTLSEK